MTIREFISYLDKDKVANAEVAFKVLEEQKWFFCCDPKEKTYEEFMKEDFFPMNLEIDAVECITDWENNGAKLLFVFDCAKHQNAVESRKEN